MKNLSYTQIELSDNARYCEYLALCGDIPADWSTALTYGYSRFMPTARAYADGMCWQHVCEHGDEFEYAPIGDWAHADWPAVFDRHVTPGTVFDYVPGCLKDRWEAVFPGQFTVTTNRDKWDYIYDLNHFAADTETKRRMLRTFHEKYDLTAVPVTSDNAGDVISFSSTADRRIGDIYNGKNDLRELSEDDEAMVHILNSWDSFDTVEGFLLRVGGRYISFMIWDAVDDRIVCLFNKNDYKFAGVHDAAVETLCRINVAKGRSLVNYTCDAGFEGLRRAKSARHPERMLEKYRMVWKGR